ncbi:hypothetical protein EFB14_08845 [Rhizobium fabae]|uniref:Uncharacterized protein n=1 Tax=Rhizobium fabae TaxID=573179 RepID=A0ABY0BBF6_9HYPH|nr:hypothetical protein EFB14_08845 [Rhizobium fabae]
MASSIIPISTAPALTDIKQKPCDIAMALPSKEEPAPGVRPVQAALISSPRQAGTFPKRAPGAVVFFRFAKAVTIA